MPSIGGGLSPKMLLIGGGILLLLLLCGLVFGLLGGSKEPSDVGYGAPVQEPESFAPATTAPESFAPPTPVLSAAEGPVLSPAEGTALEPFTPPPASSDGETWLVMLYQDADDRVLEQDIYVDLNEAERVGSNDQVHIVAQVDRYSRGFRGDGDWDSTKRFYVTYDPDLNRVSSQEIMDLGEVNMSAGESLVDFVTWAVETFPADKHVLILSDHGMGWPGGWSDPAPGGQGPRDIPLASALGDELFLMELDEALGNIREQTGIDKFELVGLDACLMGQVEVFDALAPHARYAVASEETEPALGWAYAGFLGGLTKNPGIDGADLSRLIVQSYVAEDERILDDRARADMLKGSSRGFFGLPSAQQVAQQMEDSATLAAVDLQALPALMDSLNALAYALQQADQQAVARARTYAQSYTSVFGSNVQPSYLDLANFTQLLKGETRNDAVAQAADQVLASIDKAVIAEKHGRSKPGSRGISIYFPNSQLYRSPVSGPESYVAIASRFATESLWDDFLAYHYTGRQFDPAQSNLAVPGRGEPISGPGTGTIEVSPITLSANVAAPGQPVLLSADIRGENIGHIFLFAGFLDREANSIYVADRDYLESDETREVDGVYYPVWPEGEEFTLEFEWEPLVFAINDGVDSVPALFSPETYGASYEDAVYTVDGTYTYDDGESRVARLYFDNSTGLLQQVVGFTGDGTTGAPREIIPTLGDKFTVLEKWIDLGASGKPVQSSTQEGGTLTFGAQPLEWQELDAAAGEYVVGFIVTDLDGNAYPAYAEVTVE